MPSPLQGFRDLFKGKASSREVIPKTKQQDSPKATSPRASSEENVFARQNVSFRIPRPSKEPVAEDNGAGNPLSSPLASVVCQTNGEKQQPRIGGEYSVDAKTDSKRDIKKGVRNSPPSTRRQQFFNFLRGRKDPLLPPAEESQSGKKCLVLDLDETLVHSSFRPTPNADYIIPIVIDNATYNVYVKKRPGVDDFLNELAPLYELVIYTASLSKYADPLLDRLDPQHAISYRLYREHCVCHHGSYVKDLSRLDRDLSQLIFIDDSPASFQFQPQNAIHITKFIDDMDDTELLRIMRFLKECHDSDDVRDDLAEFHKKSPHLNDAMQS